MSQYDDLSQEELLKLLGQKDEELKSKKYGLVWDAEREPEQVVLDCENNLPILQRVKGKEIRTCDEDDNILIEGDNYHALTVLNYTHKGKIDVIYIDPPYNTGNKDFIYNDNYVDREDGYRHSKWLNFMEKRLNLSKELLKETGVIFISIDDNEQAQLKMMCDKIFGEKNFVSTITIQVNKGGRDYLPIAVTHEYALCYLRSSTGLLNELPKEVDFVLEDSNGKYELRELRNRNPRFNRINRPNLYYPIYAESIAADENGQCLVSLKKTKLYNVEIFPVNSKGEDGCWRWGRLLLSNNISDKISDSNVVAKKRRDGGWNVYEKSRKSTSKAKSIWNESEVRTEQGTIDLRELGMAKSFDHPKSVSLIKKFIRLSSKKNSIILDFMAGSGTTGHAVLELNEADGGSRKFILCTNNELNGLQKELEEKGLSRREIEKHGICQRVTYPRIEKVIKGYKKNGDGEKIEGLGGNLQYFKTALVKKTKNRTQMKIDLTQKCAQMLCVKENVFNLEKEEEDYAIFSSNKKDRFLCVYYNFLEKSFDEFLKEIKKLKGKKIVYMFSTGDKVDKSLFAGVDDVAIEAIPQKILDVYRKLAKMNIPVKSDTLILDFNKAKEKVFDEKEKDESARLLRIVLAKLIQKIAQINGISILKENSQEEKTSSLNDRLKKENILSQIEWEENKTYFAIGNQAAHGEYEEYNLEQVENFYKHIQTLLNKHNI